MTWRLVVPCQIYSWHFRETLENECSFAIEKPTFQCDACGKAHTYGRALIIMLNAIEYLELTNGTYRVSPRMTEEHPLRKYFESVFSRNVGPCDCVFVRCKVGKAVQRKQRATFRRTFR